MEDTQEGTRTFRFESRHLPRFAEGIDQLAKVASKLSVPPITYAVVGTDTETFRDHPPYAPEGIDVTVEYVTVLVNGETPKLPNGWSFLGAIEHLEEGNMIHGDDETLAPYRSASANCVHCGFKRNRKKTVVVRDENGNLAQVGTACVKDFLGYHGNPERIAGMLDSFSELISEFDEDDEDRPRGGYYGADGTPTELFLTVVAAIVRTHGWVPKSQAEWGNTPTAEIATYVLGIRTVDKYDDDLREKVLAVRVTEEDEKEGQAVREWVRSIPADTANNYLGNVRVACLSSVVLSRHFGIAASAVSARRKDEEKTREREEDEGKRASSNHVGAIGERLTLDVTIKFVRSYENQFGMTYLVDMEDDSGNRLKSFSSGKFGRDADKGDRATIKGTVKEHELWRSEKGTEVRSTMLTRVSVLKWHEDEPS